MLSKAYQKSSLGGDGDTLNHEIYLYEYLKYSL